MILKQKRSNEEEQRMIRQFMEAQKIKQMMEEEARKAEAFNDFERKRQNYLKLLVEIENRRKLSTKPNRSARKTKKNKKSTLQSDKKPKRYVNEVNIEDVVVGDEDANYSKLYNEYKNIVHQKNNKHSLNASGQQQTPQASNKTRLDEEEKYSNRKDFQSKKEELKARFTDLNKRFDQNILNNPNAVYHNNNNNQNRLTISQDGQEQFENSRKKVPGLHLRIPDGENREAITEIENSIFFNDNYIQGESLVIPSQSTGGNRPIDDGTEEYDQEEQEIESEREEEEDSSPGNTTRANLEIIEAAAIFIQKNYRGYRTRKLLRQYFEQLCEEDELVSIAAQQQMYEQQFGRNPENDEVENDEIENDEIENNNIVKYKKRSRSLGDVNIPNYGDENNEADPGEEEEYSDQNQLALEEHQQEEEEEDPEVQEDGEEENENEEENEINFLEEDQKKNIFQLLAM